MIRYTRERWLSWRNRLLADPRFQRFARRTPVMRSVASHHARRLFDIVAGFTYSQTLAALIDSRTLEFLSEGPATSGSLGERIGLAPDATRTLLCAGAALGLLERSPSDRWTLGPLGVAALATPGVAAMIEHHRALYADLADPLALLRSPEGGSLARYWHYARASGQGGAAEVASYSALMTASQPMVADQLLDAYRFARHARVLDVGGGEGLFAERLATRYPQLTVGVFDLPAVVRRAAGRPAESHGGDFLTDDLPRGYDCVTLIRILHDHDDAPALALLRNIRAALVPGDTLVIAEPLANTPGARAMGHGYFGWYLKAMGSGRPRTSGEIAAMLRAAGFDGIRRRRTTLPIVASVMIARAC